MAAGIHNILCEQGATFRRVINWTDQDGVAIDITDCVARMQVRNTYKSEAYLLNLSSVGEDPTITVDGSAGRVTIVIPAEVTADIPVGPKVYDVEVEFSNGDVVRLLEGQFTVDPEVTR